VLATDALGAVASSISHKPFGEVHTSTGLDTGLGFPGQVYHWESELHQNWMRDYDPTTGRYIQADPLGLVDGASVYGYALQSPGRFVDPRGEQTAISPSGFWARVTSIAGGAAAIDGPVPVGDVAAFCILGAAYVYCETGGTLCTVEDGRDRPYENETPDDNPDDYRPVRGGGKENTKDGSYWEKDHSGHGGSKWKRWPDRRNKDRFGDRDRESVRPDGSVR